jgi:hypothetical protein
MVRRPRVDALSKTRTRSRGRRRSATRRRAIRTTAAP